MIKIKVNNDIVEITAGSSCTDLAKQLNLVNPNEAIGVKINGELKELSTKLENNDNVSFINFDDVEGKKIFWHTSAHVLAQAVKRIWPDATPTIGPPIENGFYYDFANVTISEKDFPLIEKEIKNIIKENYKPEKIIFKSKKEAIKAFSENKYKIELINQFEDEEISGYKQEEFLPRLQNSPLMKNLNRRIIQMLMIFIKEHFVFRALRLTVMKT